MSACACALVDDYLDRPEPYEGRWVVARKPHTCVECGGTIEPGDRYYREKGLWSGEWDCHHTCEPCQHIRRDVYCSGWEIGGLREAWFECYGWDYVDGPGDEEDE